MHELGARAHCPSLESVWALEDNAAGAAPARQVIARVEEYMARWPVQHGASYPLSVEAAARVAVGRAGAARLVGVIQPPKSEPALRSLSG